MCCVFINNLFVQVTSVLLLEHDLQSHTSALHGIWAGIHEKKAWKMTYFPSGITKGTRGPGTKPKNTTCKEQEEHVTVEKQQWQISG